MAGIDDAGHSGKVARDSSGSTVGDQRYTLASNRARQISEESSAAEAEWKAYKCISHFIYRLQGKIVRMNIFCHV